MTDNSDNFDNCENDDRIGFLIYVEPMKMILSRLLFIFVINLSFGDNRVKLKW